MPFRLPADLLILMRLESDPALIDRPAPISGGRAGGRAPLAPFGRALRARMDERARLWRPSGMRCARTLAGGAPLALFSGRPDGTIFII